MSPYVKTGSDRAIPTLLSPEHEETTTIFHWRQQRKCYLFQMVLLFSSMYVEYDNAVLISSDNTTGADWEQQLVDQAKKGDVDSDEDETFVLDAD